MNDKQSKQRITVITNDAELLAEEIQRIDAGLEGYLQQTGNLPEDD